MKSLKTLSFIAFLMCFCLTLDAASFTSIKDGLWEDPLTWDLLSVPTTSDDVTINHTVTTSTSMHYGGNMIISPAASLICDNTTDFFHFEFSATGLIRGSLILQKDAAVMQLKGLADVAVFGTVTLSGAGAKLELQDNSVLTQEVGAFLNIDDAITLSQNVITIFNGQSNIGGDFTVTDNAATTFSSSSMVTIDGNLVLSSGGRAEIRENSLVSMSSISMVGSSVLALYSACVDVDASLIIIGSSVIVNGDGSLSLNEDPSGSDVVFLGGGSTANIGKDVVVYGGPGATCNSTCPTCRFVLRGTGTGLPIELASFNVKNNNCEVDLNWSTESEENNDYFVIEKSSDGVNFTEIGRVKGMGNSQVLTSYSFTHDIATEAVVLSAFYYRLMQVDYDGHFSYSDILHTNIDCLAPEIDDFLSPLYPNPVKGKAVNFKFQNNFKEFDGVVLISDALGRIVLRKTVTIAKGASVVQFSVETLDAGIYSFQLQKGEYWYSKPRMLSIM